MTTRTPFLAWVWRTQRKRLLFIHLVLGLLAWSLLTDLPERPWDIVGWCFLLVPCIGYWTGNYWYWHVRLDKGDKC